jgi:hypothetical protein
LGLLLCSRFLKLSISLCIILYTKVNTHESSNTDDQLGSLRRTD